jgi:hypothetical protein
MAKTVTPAAPRVRHFGETLQASKYYPVSEGTEHWVSKAS